MQQLYPYVFWMLLLIGGWGVRDTVAQSPPATNYENSGVVSEMIGSDAAGRVAYTDEVVAEFSTPAVQARVDAVAREMRLQLERSDFLLASNKPYLEESSRPLDVLLGRRTEGDNSSSRSLVAAMCGEGLPEHATRTLIQNVSGLLAHSVDATSLVRAVRAFNTMIDEASVACLDAPSEEMYAIRGVLMGLLDAVKGNGGTKNFSILIHAAHNPREHLSPIQFPEKEQGLTIRTPVIFPGTTIATPTAYGARWGQVYVSGSYQPLSRYYTLADSDWRRGIWADGTISLGGGLGNPHRWAGVDITLNLLDTFGMWSTQEFGNERSISVKVHRVLFATTSIAVGYENMWQNSSTGSEGGSSVYVVASKKVVLSERAQSPFGQLFISVGLGNDRFLSESSFQRRENGVNAFGNAALRVVPSLTAIAEWTGQDMNLGFSVRPHPRLPVVITPAVVDLTGRAGDRPRFSIGIATTYDFRR